MRTNTRVAAQVIVIMGFVVAASSGVISYEQTVSGRGYDFNGLRQIVLPLLNPLMTIAALFAWWWLTKVDARDELQRRNFQRAYAAFTIQYLATTALLLFLVTPWRTFGGFWLTSVLWLQMVGAFIIALGLILFSLTLRKRVAVDDSVAGVQVLS